MENIALDLDKILGLCGFILKPIIILIVCKILIGIILKLLNNILKKANLDEGIKGFVTSAARVAMWAIAIIIAAGSLGVDTTSLVAIVGVASLALSLSVQNILVNAFSGITILLSKPFSVGDFVETCGISGTIKNISLMRTIINTTDNKVILIPNGDISASKVINYSTEPLRRVDLVITACYSNSTASVKEAIMEVIRGDSRIKTDETHKPFVRISNYNANDIEYTIRVWVENADYWDVYFDLTESIREYYEKHNIEFSYPHTVIHMAK